VRLGALERSDFVRGHEVRRNERHRFDGTPPVRHLKHAIGVESVPGSPLPPGAFDTLSGVDEDAVEIEQDRPA
jgi:hypothetical protein